MSACECGCGGEVGQLLPNGITRRWATGACKQRVKRQGKRRRTTAELDLIQAALEEWVMADDERLPSREDALAAVASLRGLHGLEWGSR